MLTPQQREYTIQFLLSLMHSSGGGKETVNASPTLTSTLSVCKALRMFNVAPPIPDTIRDFVLSHYHPASSSFQDEQQQPSVLASAAGLLTLWSIDAHSDFQDLYPSTTAFMRTHASTREEHFMLIAVANECSLVDVDLSVSISFFRALEHHEGGFGESPLTNAIAASALLRAGEQPINVHRIAQDLLSIQQSGGWFEDVTSSNLWTTYCIMRLLDLTNNRPTTTPLATYIQSMFLPSGGYGIDGSMASASATYQCLSILDWITGPPIRAARSNDVAALRDWLASGGDPNITNLYGWTPLMAAAVRGNTSAVQTLLHDGAMKADPNVRLEVADALPIFWAGQSGNVDTVKALLNVAPQHLFEISSVNGHTLLLQAVFFGSEHHVQIVRWILESYALVLDLHDEHQRNQALRQLFSACNVRGYTAVTMSVLWNNTQLTELLKASDPTTPADRNRYYLELLAYIAEPVPDQEPQRTARLLADEFAEQLSNCFSALISAIERSDVAWDALTAEWLATLTTFVSAPQFDINALGGPLMQTPVIMAVTGVNSTPQMAEFRRNLVTMLLDRGANPDIPEKHPMGVDAVIRAAVLNHFDVLQIISKHMPPLAFAAALNDVPAINGQTALHDTVHRALTSADDDVQRHLDQIRWCIEKGARYNLEDHTGTTALELALRARNDTVFQNRATMVLDALGVTQEQPHDAH